MTAFRILLVLALFFPLGAHAYQVASIRAGEGMTPVFSAPKESSSPIERLAPGVRLYASDRSSSGFYKVKTPSGKIGWVAAINLVLTKAKPSVKAPAPKQRARVERKAPSDGLPSIGVRVFGGMSLFPLTDLNELYAASELSNGTGFGGEALFRLSRKVWLVLHIEKISKQSTAEDSTGNGYLLDVSSMPVMLGADFELKQTRRFRLGLTVLAGLAASTKFTSQAAFEPEPNTTQYSGSPMSFLGRLDGEFLLSRSFGLGVYAGYRLLSAPEAPPVLAGKTYPEDPLRDSVGEPIDQAINLSGPVVGASLTYRF